jgi:hypothetical protein
MITTEQIRKIIQNNIESNEPADTILRILKENEGKRLDKRVIDKMQAAIPNWWIRDCREYGMTQIKWAVRWDSEKHQNIPTPEGQTEGSLLVAHEVKYIYINSEEIKGKNPAYFSARDERNSQRREILEQREGFFQNIVRPMNKFAEAHEELKNLFNSLEGFPDKYDVEKLVPKVS